MCVNGTVKCPPGFSSEYCYVFDLDARIRDGTFAYIDDIERVKVWGGHAMNIVGYNDDWVYHNRKGSERGLATIRGGFIMHNSWSEPGHSVDFLMGRLSEENEAVQCPNHLSPVNWIPARADCLRNHDGNASACGTNFPRVRGKGLTKQTDVLVCTNMRYCNVSRKYALAELDNDVDAQPLFNGVDRVHLISWTSGDDVTDEFIDYLPFFALRMILQPANLTENAPGLCGYWMYPYHAVELVNRVEWSLLDTFHVSDIVFEFTNESYARSGFVAPGKNYTLLKESTYQYNRIPFGGPLPYDYVY
jgi:hypothetical protein